MNIKIDKDYCLKSDPRNVILTEIKTNQETGEPYEKQISFHGTVQGALKGYLRIKTNTSDATTVQELLQEIERAEKNIESVLQGR